MSWKSVRKGINVNEAVLPPEKNRGRTGKETCKSVEQEENHKKGPRWSWVRSQMGNLKLILGLKGNAAHNAVHEPKQHGRSDA